MKKLPQPDLPGFEEFWQVWRPHMRHTDGKGDARTAYRKHYIMGADPQDMIDGAAGFFRFMAEKDKPYVPLAASWLNKEAYPDWAERERRYQAHQAEKAGNSNVVPIAPQRKTKFLEQYEQMQREA